MKRREFLKSVGVGAASFSAIDLLANYRKSKPLGLQLFSVREYVSKDLEATLEKIASIGYRELEIYGYDGNFFGKTTGEFKALLKNTGLKVVSSHHASGIGMKSQGSLTNGWEKAVEDLNEIGAKNMVCPYLFPSIQNNETFAMLPDLLNKSGEITKAANIQFAYHNHDFEFKKYDEHNLVFDHIIQNTSADLVKIELDLYWIIKAGFDPLQYFKKYPGRFPLWHVKDMEAKTGDITEIGNGVIDFDRIFAARELAGLETWFVEQDVTKGEMYESITSSFNYLVKKNFK
ncbi:sugar phosphate isomerase/epimerase family protein [Jiulongibacter sp. NS-SX5]|uniref:sugar phosphate isomerase/epimerase family protein n=1 Tax=Jiulongibacter sp. NS-SX5 TaxID=3463854 RepID=UPI004059CB40